MPTPAEIADAWHGVTDRWFTRRNKLNSAEEQWEVVHDWGVDLVSEETMKVIGKFATSDPADLLADECENEARGAAVLALFNR